MKVLKGVLVLLATIAGLIVFGTIGLLMISISVAIWPIFLGMMAVTLVVIGIKEYFEKPSKNQDL